MSSLVEQGDLCLPVAAAYPIYTLGTNIAGVFTACAATVKATLLTINKTNAVADKVTCIALNNVGIIPVQFHSTTAANTALFQAAAGKVDDTDSGSALAFGQSVEAVTVPSGSSVWGRVLVTR